MALDDLPEEMWAYILSFLGAHEALPAALACRLFRDLLRRQHRAGDGRGTVQQWTTWAGIAAAGSLLFRRWTMDLGRPPFMAAQQRRSEAGRIDVWCGGRQLLHSHSTGVSVLSFDLREEQHSISAPAPAPAPVSVSVSDPDPAASPLARAMAVSEAGEVFLVNPGKRCIDVFSCSSGDLLRSLVTRVPRSSTATEMTEMLVPTSLCAAAPQNGKTALYACSRQHCRVFVIDASTGALLRSWGGRGRGVGMFYSPQDIKISPAGDEVYVSDKGNCRVAVFRPDGTALRLLGEWGSSDGQLESPQGICPSPWGTLFVCDSSKDYVQELHCTTGAFVRRWSLADNGDMLPTSAAVGPGGEVFVSDANSVLRVFV